MGNGYNGYHGNGQWMNGNMGSGAWLGMGLMMTIGLAVLVALVIWLVRMSSSSPSPARQGTIQTPPASAILDERFARGEIDEDEYLERRQTLGAPQN